MLTASFNDCLVCLLTPPGRAAVASIAVEGTRAVEIVSRFYSPAGATRVEDAPLGRIVFGHWIAASLAPTESAHDRPARPAPTEGVVLCRTAPDRIEIHCHGGKAAAQAIVESLTSAGCREVAWRTWAAAAERDPIAAEARIALADARTQRAAAILLDQYRGALRQAIDGIVTCLEAAKREESLQRLDNLLQLAPLGLHLTKPWRIVLAGHPNVGKSSLINALVGYHRSIVHDTPGVTRDVVTASTALDGWPVELADTAGVRESLDELEAAGVARTRAELHKADVVVLVFDASAPWSEEDARLIAAAPGAILAHNKSDLVAGPRTGSPAGIATSAVTGQGLEQLKRALTARLAPKVPLPGAAVPFTERQADAIREARRLVDADDVDGAAGILHSLV